MIRCDKCDRIFDSDDDPGCFDEDENRVTCERCREVNALKQFALNCGNHPYENGE